MKTWIVFSMAFFVSTVSFAANNTATSTCTTTINCNGNAASCSAGIDYTGPSAGDRGICGTDLSKKYKFCVSETKQIDASGSQVWVPVVQHYICCLQAGFTFATDNLAEANAVCDKI